MSAANPLSEELEALARRANTSGLRHGTLVAFNLFLLASILQAPDDTLGFRFRVALQQFMQCAEDSAREEKA